MPTYREILEDPAVFGDPVPPATQPILDALVAAATEGTDVGSGSGATELDELSDVQIGTPSTGQVLVFNGTLWAPDDVPAPPAPSLEFGGLNPSLISNLVGLWHFDGSLAKASGSVSDFETPGGGVPGYLHVNGKQGVDMSDRLATVAHDAALELTGALTVHMLLSTRHGREPGSIDFLFAFGTVSASSTEANNFLYSLYANAAGRLVYRHETGANSLREFEFEVGFPSGTHLVSLTRASNGADVALYIDGRPAGLTGTVTDAPTGGTGSVVLLFTTVGLPFIAQGLAISSSQQSAAQIKAVWNDLCPAGLAVA